MELPNAKNIRRKVVNAYKKVPKKKLLKQTAATAADYTIRQLIPGPIIDLMGFVFNKSKTKALRYAGNIAYDKFFKSKYAREKINVIPMALLSMLIRTVLNAMILVRIKTGINYIDFIISVIITIIITLLSPLFYGLIRPYEDTFMILTNKFVDNFMEGGMEYLESIKNKILIITGLSLIVVLRLISVDSYYLQELIIHTLISGFVSDQIQRYLNSKSVIKICYIGMEFIETPIPRHIIHIHPEPSLAYKRNTKNIIVKCLRPQKAEIIKIIKLSNNKIIQ